MSFGINLDLILLISVWRLRVVGEIYVFLFVISPYLFTHN
jgi:hypothetical protein